MTKLETPVQTHTLRLILDTLIDLATPVRPNQDLQEKARKTVSGVITPPILDNRSSGGRL